MSPLAQQLQQKEGRRSNRIKRIYYHILNISGMNTVHFFHSWEIFNFCEDIDYSPFFKDWSSTNVSSKKKRLADCLLWSTFILKQLSCIKWSLLSSHWILVHYRNGCYPNDCLAWSPLSRFSYSSLSFRASCFPYLVAKCRARRTH